ncbi:hypothetical protein ACFVYE_43475 [Streptomyces sp. NPDC058239]|uniref:hypothetical protein n=1 Tax=Streptomyces sp. NPDC058239 TaxID=3346395 RepID=UPI0036E44554
MLGDGRYRERLFGFRLGGEVGRDAQQCLPGNPQLGDLGVEFGQAGGEMLDLRPGLLGLVGEVGLRGRFPAIRFER